MKFTHTCIALCLTLSLALAQTPSPTSPAPAPAPPKKAPAAIGSAVPKTAPNVPDTRNPGWETRANGNTTKAKALGDAISLVFDGDSITDFWQTRGKQIWTERYAKFHAFDFAISGDTTQNLLWRLANGQAQGLHPKLIVLMIGTNDMKYSSTPQEIADGVKEILAQYQKICPNAVILLQAIFPRGNLATDPYRLKVKATNEILAKLADGTKVVYIDFGDKFLTADGTLEKDIMPDFLHPSAKGYGIWADAIQPSIDTYLK